MDTPKLDRQVYFDPRSRQYAQPGARKPRSYTNHLGVPPLDQGNVGHCVGFAAAHEAQARPAIRHQTNTTAHQAFYVAQRIDREQHNLNFPDGATILAGLKAGQQLRWWTGYQWNFTLAEGLATAVGYHGPAILGTNWYRGMTTLNPLGEATPTGPVEGGHAYLCVGVDIRNNTFLCVNSWSPAWGGCNWRGQWRPGHFILTASVVDRLLREDGEAATPTGRILR